MTKILRAQILGSILGIVAVLCVQMPVVSAFDPSVDYGYPDNYGESVEAGSGYSGNPSDGDGQTGQPGGGGQTGQPGGGGQTGQPGGGGQTGQPGGGGQTGQPGGVGGTENDSGEIGYGDVGANIDLFNPLGDKSIGDIFLAILDIIMVFAVPIILFFLVWAGFLYVTARGNQQQLEKAHRALLYAIIGGLLVLGAQVLLFTITNTVGLFDQ